MWGDGVDGIVLAPQPHRRISGMPPSRQSSRQLSRSTQARKNSTCFAFRMPFLVLYSILCRIQTVGNSSTNHGGLKIPSCSKRSSPHSLTLIARTRSRSQYLDEPDRNGGATAPFGFERCFLADSEGSRRRSFMLCKLRIAQSNRNCPKGQGGPRQRLKRARPLA